MQANWSLQKSIFNALSSNQDVTNLLGGSHFYDHVPPNAKFPYVTFGQTTVRDWSTGTESGHEHVLTLHVWSRSGGRGQTQMIVGALEAALHEQALALEAHRLVNLRFEFADTRRDPDGETIHGIIRYRAVTEPTD